MFVIGTSSLIIEFAMEAFSVFVGALFAYLMASFHDHRKKVDKVRQMSTLLVRELESNRDKILAFKKQSEEMLGLVNKQKTGIAFQKANSYFMNTANRLHSNVYEMMLNDLVLLPEDVFFEVTQVYNQTDIWVGKLSEIQQECEEVKYLRGSLEGDAFVERQQGVVEGFALHSSSSEITDALIKLDKVMPAMHKFAKKSS